MKTYTTDTVIIGAGPSGLAVAACLTRAQVPFILLERESQVGAAWTKHYERLHLHTVKRHSNLPHFPFPEHVEKYPSRQAVVDYLTAYAGHFGLEPRLGEDVTRVARKDGGWRTATRKAEYQSQRVIIASGYNRRPVLPRWPGMETYTGNICHSADYRNGKKYAGKRVLVVGIGNTGGEIAIDLHEHGAAGIHISVRSPVNVVPRDYLGTPTQVTGIMLSKLPKPLEYFLSRRLARMSTGDLSAYGIFWPEISPAESVNKYGRVPLIDVGTIGLIKRGIITVVQSIEKFTPTGVVFSDGHQHEYDNVILATGYRPRLEEFLEHASEMTDESGYPIPPAGASSRPGLYFLGFCNPTTGFLRQIALDAQRIADEIARKHAESPAHA